VETHQDITADNLVNPFIRVHADPKSLSLLLLIAIRAPHDLLTDIRATQPRHIPSRLIMSNPAPRIPPAINTRVVAPVLIVNVLALRLRAIHTVKTQSIEVRLSVRLGLKHHNLPLHAAAASASGYEVELEGAQAVDDLLNGRVADYVFDGESVDLGKRVEVLADSCVPAGACFSAVTEEVAYFLVERLMKRSLQAAAGVVDRA
jgi:hypothetical protein